MNDNHPRFRTMHEAGKFLAAQLYPAGRALTPEDYGAVKRYVENPAWEKARFSAVFCESNPEFSYILTDGNVHPVENGCLPPEPANEPLKTAADWYKLSPYPTILFPDGWESGPSFHGEFHYRLIPQAEFEKRRSNSTTY